MKSWRSLALLGLIICIGPVSTSLGDEPAGKPVTIGYKYTVIKGGTFPVNEDGSRQYQKSAQLGEVELKVDGTYYVDQTVRLYRKGVAIGPAIPVKTRISALAIAPDGVTIAVAEINGGGDYATVYAVNGMTGEKIKVRTAGSDARPVFDMHFSDDGKTLEANVSEQHQR
jgi:hypothetical protein